MRAELLDLPAGAGEWMVADALLGCLHEARATTQEREAIVTADLLGGRHRDRRPWRPDYQEAD